MATKPSQTLLGIVDTDLSPVENQLAVLQLQRAIDAGASYYKTVNAVGDEYEDETGIKSTAVYGANTVPVMTTTTAPSGTVIFDAESSPTYAAWKAFDADAATRWARNSAGQAGTIGYDYGTGNGKTITKITMQAPTTGNGEMPNAFTIEGWNGSAWVVLSTVASTGAFATSEERDFTFTNTTSYEKYQLNITTSQDATNVTMGRLQMFESNALPLSVDTTYDATGDYIHNEGVGDGTPRTPATGQDMAPFTDYAHDWYITNSTTVTQIAIHSLTASSALKIKIGKVNSVTDIDTVVNQAVTHGGTGWEDFTLDTPYVIPATGNYAVGASGAHRTIGTTTASRSYFSGDANGTGEAFTNDTSATLLLARIPQPSASMTLASNTFTAEAEPTTARIVILHQPVVATTLNTDFTAEVSIDAGVTWAAVTLEDLGEFSTGINILAGTADVTSQTGTSMQYRLKTLNAKEQRVHGTWLQWS